MFGTATVREPAPWRSWLAELATILRLTATARASSVQVKSYLKLSAAVALSTSVLLMSFALAIRGCGREAASAVVAVVEELKPGRTTTIVDYVPLGTEGTSELIVARTNGISTFEEQEEWPFWPDVVVQVKVEHSFNYFVPLDRQAWRVSAAKDRRGDATIFVVAPAPRITLPHISSSVERVRYVETSWGPDERRVLEDLLRSLRERLLLPQAMRQLEELDAVRDKARQQVQLFVRTWLTQEYHGSPFVRPQVVVKFADE